MEQPVKIIVSSLALYETLRAADISILGGNMIDLTVENGKLKIGEAILHIEHNRAGSLSVMEGKLAYLRDILSKVWESPVVLIIRGDTLFLSEIYI